MVGRALTFYVDLDVTSVKTEKSSGSRSGSGFRVSGSGPLSAAY